MVKLTNIYIYTSSSSSSGADSKEFPDSLLPSIPIIHRTWQVLWAASCVPTELI